MVEISQNFVAFSEYMNFKKKMHSKEHMYVSGLEFSRAAAASHKVEKGKKGRDFKVKKARSFVQKRFGVIFCSCSSNCIVMCIRIHGAEHTGGTFFK